MNDPQDTVILSEVAAQRREAMLGDLVASMRRIHRVRHTRRRIVFGAAVVIILASVVVAVVALLTPRTAPAPGIVQGGGGAIHPVPAPFVVVMRVATDPSILERCRAAPQSVIERVDDEGLLAALASIDRPAGLIRMNGEVRLTADVIDRDIAVR